MWHELLDYGVVTVYYVSAVMIVKKNCRDTDRHELVDWPLERDTAGQDAEHLFVKIPYQVHSCTTTMHGLIHHYFVLTFFFSLEGGDQRFAINRDGGWFGYDRVRLQC